METNDADPRAGGEGNFQAVGAVNTGVNGARGAGAEQ